MKKPIKPKFPQGTLCKINFKGSLSGRVAKVISTSFHGDVELEFKNGKTVMFHQNWLTKA